MQLKWHTGNNTCMPFFRAISPSEIRQKRDELDAPGAFIKQILCQISYKVLLQVDLSTEFVI